MARTTVNNVLNNELSPDFDMTAQNALHTLRYKIQIIKIGYMIQFKLKFNWKTAVTTHRDGDFFS